MEVKFSDKIPAYEGGTRAEGVYNAGPMLADDSLHVTDEDSPMILFTGTNEEEFRAYLDKLRAEDWKTAEYENPAYLCAEARKDGTRFCAYLTKASGEVRIVEQRGGEQICAAAQDPRAGDRKSTV